MPDLCPCGASQNYESCCGLYISGALEAPTPEALMRSRYSAFAKRKFLYLTQTQAQEAAKRFDLASTRRDAPFLKWLKLEILSTEIAAEVGYVKFRAHYSLKSRVFVLEEHSRFEKIEGRWFYVGVRGGSQ